MELSRFGYLVLACGLTTALVACGGNESGAAAGGSLPAPSGKAIPPSASLAAQLPGLPFPRVGSGLLETSQEGSETFDRSPEAQPQGSALLLSAGPNELSWGIWELPALDELRYLDVDLDPLGGPGTGSLYLGLANYADSGWDIEGPVFAGRVLELDPLIHASPGAAAYLAVLAFDGASVAVNQLSLIAFHANASPAADLQADVSSGVAPLTVQFDAGGSADPDPGDGIVCYRWDFEGDGSYGETSFVPQVTHTYASAGTYAASVAVEDHDGDRASASLEVDVAAANEAPTARLEILPAEVAPSAPFLLDASLSSDPEGAIAKYEFDLDGDGSFESDMGTTSSLSWVFTSGGVYELGLRVTDGAGATATAFRLLRVRAWSLPQYLDTEGSGVGEYPCLALVNGFPAVAYYSQEVGLCYMRAQDAAGSSWGGRVVVDGATGDEGRSPSLAVINGNPAIAYGINDVSTLWYVRATNANGGNWGAPLEVDNGSNTGFYCSLAEVSGAPAICHTSYQAGRLLYIRATDANGSAWGGTKVIDAAAGPLAQGCLTVVGGVPGIGYYRSADESLQFVLASDATGASWGSPVLLDADGGYMAMARNGSIAGIAYYDSGNTRLRFIYAANSSATVWNAPVTAASNLANFSGPALAFHEGIARLAYTSNQRVYYAAATNAFNTAWMPPLEIVSFFGGSQRPSFLPVKDRPAVAYHSQFDIGSLAFVRAESAYGY